MAWAEPLKGGGYRGRYYDQHRKVRSVLAPDGKGFRYKKHAKRAAEDAASLQRRQATVVAGEMPATITWSEWWELLSQTRVFNATDTGRVEGLIVDSFIRPKWGEKPLNEISRQMVQDWVDRDLKLGPRMSAGYVAKIYSVFNVSIKQALEKEILATSPCVRIKLPKITKKPKPFLSTSAADSMAASLRDDYVDAIAFGLETGVRPGELCGLHADHVDLERGWMTVRHVLVERMMKIRPWPKDGDTREVPLTDRAVEIVQRRLAGRELNGGCGLPHTDETRCDSVLVFRTNWRRPMRPNTLLENMKVHAKANGVQRRTPYAVRRGWATRAAEGGLDAFQIAEILGHSTLEEAQGYVQRTSRARNKLQEALGGGALRGAQVGHQEYSDDDTVGS